MGQAACVYDATLCESSGKERDTSEGGDVGISGFQLLRFRYLRVIKFSLLTRLRSLLLGDKEQGKGRVVADPRTGLGKSEVCACGLRVHVWCNVCCVIFLIRARARCH